MLSSAERQRLRELELIPADRRSPSETAELADLRVRSRDFSGQACFVERDPGMPDDPGVGSVARDPGMPDDDDPQTGIGRDPSLPEDK